MKKNKILLMKIFKYLFIVLILISTLFLSYSLILFNGVERFYIICGILLVIYISSILIYSLIFSFKGKKFKKFMTTLIISIIFVSIYSVGGYLIYNVYSKIDTFNKDMITYTTSLITFDSKYNDVAKIKDTKIGIVKDTDDIELYVLPNEVIKNNDLEKNNEIVEYNSVIDLMNALFNKEVEMIFVNGNYKDVFYNLEEYKDIKDTKVITDYSKKLEKTTTEKGINISSGKNLTEPFTILLLGIDSSADGLDKNAAFNGDTIMILSFNPKTLNATMFSIPRDTYVKIACGNRQMQKINTSAYGGTSCVIKTIKNMTGIDIDYYAKVNFKGVVDLVDALGGVTVDVPYKFCEQNSNRDFGEFTIYLDKGVQTLNGEEALALARNRKTHPEYCSSEWNKDGTRNDFVRGQNQQLVVEAMLNGVKSIKSANKLMEILDVVSKNIDTNLSTDQMLSFYEVIKTIIASGDINVVNIQKTLLTGYDMYVYEPSASGTRYAFFNWKGSLDDIVEAIEINLGEKEPKIIKEFSFSINEIYEKELIGASSYKESKLGVVPDFSMYSVESIKKWGESNNITIKIMDTDSKEITGSTDNYTFSSQSVHAKTLIAKSGDIINIYLKEKVSVTKKPEQTGSTIEDGGNQED